MSTTEHNAARLALEALDTAAKAELRDSDLRVVLSVVFRSAAAALKAEQPQEPAQPVRQPPCAAHGKPFPCPTCDVPVAYLSADARDREQPVAFDAQLSADVALDGGPLPQPAAVPPEAGCESDADALRRIAQENINLHAKLVEALGEVERLHIALSSVKCGRAAEKARADALEAERDKLRAEVAAAQQEQRDLRGLIADSTGERR